MHQMQQLNLCHFEFRVSEAKKSEMAAIVATALGEICEILSLSNNLTSLEVNYFELGAENLTTANEYRLLECLG